MPNDYDWSFDTSDGWTDTSQYNLDGSSGGGWADTNQYDLGGSSVETEDWYIDSTGAGQSDFDTSMFDDIWSWVKSDTGVNVVGGVASGLAKMYQMKEQLDAQKELLKYRKDLEGPSAAELYDARVKKHNESINKPMDMGLVNLKRS